MKKKLLCILTDEQEYLENKKNFLIIDKNILDILEAKNFFTNALARGCATLTVMK